MFPPRTASLKRLLFGDVIPSIFARLGERIASTRRVVIVGKTGNGKSSLGNRLIGRKSFAEGGGFNAVTLKSVLEENVDKLAVVDTPGLFDTSENPGRKVVEGALSLVEALNLFAEPHAFLIVFNGACRLTEEELSVIDVLRISFGNECMKHAIVVITHIDNDVDDCEFEDGWKNCEQLRKIVEECGGRVARINNKDPSKEHIEKILKNIEDVSNEGKKSYTCPYKECRSQVLEKEAELETYNGWTTHQRVLQLTTRISENIREAIEMEEIQAKAALKEQMEKLEAERNRNSAIGSATAGIVTGITTAGVAGTMTTSTPIIVAGSVFSGGIVCATAFGLFSYYYSKRK